MNQKIIDYIFLIRDYLYETLMKNSEIYLARYDSAADTFIQAAAITDNAVYDYSPVITFENGTSMPSLYAEEHLQEKDGLLHNKRK